MTEISEGQIWSNRSDPDRIRIVSGLRDGMVESRRGHWNHEQRRWMREGILTRMSVALFTAKNERAPQPDEPEEVRQSS
ncbi:MAG TPA: hypothetical protein VHE14_07605 [Solirubrobacteraceae bacterium]|nr:hypothetical protein [Solirubrobacteraceae bacterium]